MYKIKRFTNSTHLLCGLKHHSDNIKKMLHNYLRPSQVRTETSFSFETVGNIKKMVFKV